jgi:hypothetical protein
MYQDQDAGLSGPVIIYNEGMMDTVMSQYREFVVFYGDNQESNSFLALQNVMKYLPSQAGNVANLSYKYPEITSTGNESIWYPQLTNHPMTNVTTTMAPNFFPVCLFLFLSAVLPQNGNEAKELFSPANVDCIMPDQRLHLRQQPCL